VVQRWFENFCGKGNLQCSKGCGVQNDILDIFVLQQLASMSANHFVMGKRDFVESDPPDTGRIRRAGFGRWRMPALTKLLPQSRRSIPGFQRLQWSRQIANLKYRFRCTSDLQSDELIAAA
jgi:hypothetical protein